MATLKERLDEACPALKASGLGTWLQMVYTAEAEYRSRYATNLTALQAGRALLNEIRAAWATNYATMTSARDLGNELRTDSTTNAAFATGVQRAILNQSYTKPAMVIGSTSSAKARANTATIYGTINGVWYACAATEAAFTSPADSFAPAATRVSRLYTISYTASGTLTHSTGATISGTASAPVTPALTANTFPVAIMKIVLKAGSATRFNAGTTTLGAPGLTTTFTEVSYIATQMSSFADPVSSAAISYPAPSTISAAMSTPGAALTSGNALLSLDIDESAISW